MRPSLAVPLLVFSLVLVLPSGAQAPTWTADLAWPTVVPGHWAPLVVTVDSPAPWTLEVRPVTGSGRASGPVEYSRGVGGRFEFPLYLDDATRTLDLRFLSRGLVVRAWTLPLQDRLFPGHLIGTDGLAADDRLRLTEVLLPQEPVRVLPLPPSSLPSHPFSYGGLSALVLRDPGPVLSPPQATALRAWVATGGRLVLVAPRSGTASLRSQLGEVEGAGAVVSTQLPVASWHDLVALAPYGQRQRWGTDFDPPPRDLPSRGSSSSVVLVVFVLVWAGVGTLGLVLRRRGSAAWPVSWAALGTVAAVVVIAAGGLDWDRGLPVHGREIVVPGVGRFISTQALRPAARSGFLDWSSSSPWAMAPLRASQTNPAAVVRLATPDRWVWESFEPEAPRTATYQVKWDGQLRWIGLEEAPLELAPDLPWLTRLAASSPGRVWSVGTTGTTTWVRP